MCLVRRAIQHGLSRRAFLKAAGALVAAPAVAERDARRPRAQDAPGDFRTRVVLLGTAGGPQWSPGADRMSASTAVVVGDAIYLVDLGHGATLRLFQAFDTGVLSTGSQWGALTFLENVRALFFTHLHMDHTTDYPALLLRGFSASLGSSGRLQVIGPGDRGQLEAYVLAPYSATPEVVRTDGGTPTPGTKDLTKYVWQAFAQTINDFTFDNGAPDFTTLVDVKDVGIGSANDIRFPEPQGFRDPNTTPCLPMEPFHVYDDAANGVRVQGILVDHHQVFPSFAFRFDTDDGAVVISGDTGSDTKGNLQRLASGADVLVHEVIDRAWIDQIFPPAEQQTPQEHALYTHLVASHTPIEDVGSVAEQAVVKKLVLSHIVPGNTPEAHLLGARRGFSGELVVGRDLMSIGVGKPVARSAR